MKSFIDVYRAPFPGAGTREIATRVGVVSIALAAAMLLAGRAAQAQITVEAGLKFQSNAKMGPGIQPSSGKGVSSAVSSYTANGQTDAMYTVNGVAANFLEKDALNKILAKVKNLPLPFLGGGPDDRRKALMVSVEDNFTSGAGRFVQAIKNANTPISTTSTSFEQGAPILSVSGHQAYVLVQGGVDAVRLTSTKTGDAPRHNNYDAITLVMNKDPFAVDWADGTHEMTIDLSEVSLYAQADSGGQAAAVGDLRGGYVNGTDDTTTPESLASSLFELSMGVTSFDGSTPSADLTFSFLGDPGMISDNHGHTGLANVLAALSSQFSILRTDGDGASYFGFDSDYLLTMTVPGTEPQSVLFLEQDGATLQAVPEPGSLALVALGIVGSWCLVRQESRKRAAGRS